ncbi:peptide chain release factor N(5)-glutamine methyltransferase [Nesterenkonia sp.]|uniref:peptide chain release factor N(5)-glutamine methyltransferase n=1 Tax=Nesterenkonia sp. TaxID=704201 RepID=UPI00260240C3|nr:peptide chain release factor N(5)-glutamine methyltransferase [Nesterenkonia sp.]
MAELAAELRRAAQALAEAGVSSPRADAELLAGHVLGMRRGQLQARAAAGAELPEAAQQKLRALISERARRIPLQHLTGEAPFRTLSLRVGPGVFIPRPETEQVVQYALDRLAQLRRRGVTRPRVIDLGTGSGAIAAAVAAEHPDADVHAVELSAEAAAWAELNFQNLPEGSAAVTLHRADLRQVPDLLAAGELSSPTGAADPSGGFDVVISNPPYIPPGSEPTEVEVAEHDPQLALYGGGDDGLELPRAAVETAAAVLVDGGWFILEHAEVQADALARICTAHPQLADVTSHQDLSGRPRATSAVKTSASGPA